MAKKQKKRGGFRPGSGRPLMHPEGATAKLVADVPEVLISLIGDWADEHGMSRSAAVTEAVRRLVK